MSYDEIKKIIDEFLSSEFQMTKFSYLEANERYTIAESHYKALKLPENLHFAIVDYLRSLNYAKSTDMIDYVEFEFLDGIARHGEYFVYYYKVVTVFPHYVLFNTRVVIRREKM